MAPGLTDSGTECRQHRPSPGGDGCCDTWHGATTRGGGGVFAQSTAQEMDITPGFPPQTMLMRTKKPPLAGCEPCTTTGRTAEARGRRAAVAGGGGCTCVWGGGGHLYVWGTGMLRGEDDDSIGVGLWAVWVPPELTLHSLSCPGYFICHGARRPRQWDSRVLVSGVWVLCSVGALCDTGHGSAPTSASHRRMTVVEGSVSDDRGAAAAGGRVPVICNGPPAVGSHRPRGLLLLLLLLPPAGTMTFGAGAPPPPPG